jgi:hypothetical protein
VHLYQPYLQGCKLINYFLKELAQAHKDVKFLKIIGNMCIENYPDKNCPTLLVYGRGDVQKQFIGFESLGGLQNTTVGFLENLLLELGALQELKLSSSSKEDSRRFNLQRKDGKSLRDGTHDDDNDDEYA